MFQKNVRLYTDAELDAQVNQFVDNEIPESIELDYKADVTLQPRPSRVELAKDISSFANTVGGAVIYGIPENRINDAICVPLSPFGIDPVRGFASILENILVETVYPHLPDLVIREVALSRHQGKL